MTWLINALITLLIKKAKRRPDTDYVFDLFKKLLWVCDNRESKHPEIDFCFNDITGELLKEAVYPVLRYIDKRYDCADFRCLQLIKFRLIAGDLLEKHPEIDARIRETLTGFKFFLLSPGVDSMCYYSENHQMSFIACEYLTGKMFPETLFQIDGKPGRFHMEEAKTRFFFWCELREKYSYSEFNSANYLPVTLTSLSMLYLYSENDLIKEKAKEQLDEILKFYSETLFENTFVLASGRDYPRNLMNCAYSEPSSEIIIDSVFGDGKFAKIQYGSTHYLFASFYLLNNVYKLDEKIRALKDSEESETTRKFSLNLCDYEKEGLLDNSTRSIMMRLGSGAITNPEIIDLTIAMMKEYPQLRHNNFISWTGFFVSPLLYRLGLMGKLSKTLNFCNNRMAIEENTVYTYRNAYYRISCSLHYKPGSLGAQRNTAVVTLKGGVTVFTCHPAFDCNDRHCNQRSSPSYFGGYGYAPDAEADKNHLFINYDVRKKKAFPMLIKVHKFTHTFFPTELFDEYEVAGRHAFARVSGAYIALTGKNELYFRNVSDRVFKVTEGMLKDRNKPFDLVQDGLDTFWRYDLSCEKNESFEAFKKRISGNG